MSWLPLIAGAAALLLAVLVLGFFAYELRWKSHRLRADLDKLLVLRGQLQGLQSDIAATQQRAAQVQQSLTPDSR